MTRQRKARTDGLLSKGRQDNLEVEERTDEKIGRTLARMMLDPGTRNADLAMSFGCQLFSETHRPDIHESSSILADEIRRTIKGDISVASRILTCQAISLDTLFTEMARRSGNNMRDFPNAADRHMRLALKAQAACRSTLETLIRLHQPREQTVKHIQVEQGGQAVVADHFHQPIGGNNGFSVKQSDATTPAGASTTLPSENTIGKRMSVSGGQGQVEMQDARRHKSRCTER